MSATEARRPGPSMRTRVVEFREGTRLEHEDRLATEEPLEIRVAAPGLAAQRVAVTMRTPGHDFELSAGWLVHEGVTRPSDVAAVRYCTDEDLSPLEEFNVVTVELSAPPLSLPAARLVSSACGVCGADSVRDVVTEHADGAPLPHLDVRLLLELPDRLREQQPGFELVQKAVVSGVRAVVAVGAPTSLAVSLAEQAGLVLVGFTRGQRCVVYAGADRVGV